MGYEYTGQTPFKTIYLHGLIFDENGRKMSKSLGNGIDPIKIIDEYSADSLRLSTTLGNTPGNNLNFSMKFVENNTLFLNKLWNIVRFVHATIGEIPESEETLVDIVTKNYDSLMDHEKWIVSRLKAITDTMTEGMEKYNFSETGLELMAFTRDEFADFYLEEHKFAREESKHGREVLALSILTLLKLWHPYIPFVTEELYSKMKPGASIMLSSWPVIDITRDVKIEKEIGILYEVVRSIRNIRAEKNIKPGEQVNVVFVSAKSGQTLLESNKTILLGLAKLSEFSFSKLADIDQTKYAYGVVKDIELFLELPQGIDNTEEKARIKEQIEDKKEYIRILDLKLLNADFVRNAPAHVVQKEQEKKVQSQEQLDKLQQKYNSLS
jgi:valyl-tRNA synthetase